MEDRFVTYVELYKLKSGLLNQIKDLENLMEKTKPRDLESLTVLMNNITLGVYDYPFNGMLKDKIIFTLKQLKAATRREILKYMSIVGDNTMEANSSQMELDSTLKALLGAKILINQVSIFNPSEITYRL